MPSVLSPDQVTECFATGQEVWRNGHRAFITGTPHTLNGEPHTYLIKQGRRTFPCPASELSSKRPQQ